MISSTWLLSDRLNSAICNAVEFELGSRLFTSAPDASDWRTVSTSPSSAAMSRSSYPPSSHVASSATATACALASFPSSATALRNASMESRLSDAPVTRDRKVAIGEPGTSCLSGTSHSFTFALHSGHITRRLLLSIRRTMQYLHMHACPHGHSRTARGAAMQMTQSSPSSSSAGDFFADAGLKDNLSMSPARDVPRLLIDGAAASIARFHARAEVEVAATS